MSSNFSKKGSKVFSLMLKQLVVEQIILVHFNRHGIELNFQAVRTNYCVVIQQVVPYTQVVISTGSSERKILSKQHEI